MIAHLPVRIAVVEPQAGAIGSELRGREEVIEVCRELLAFGADEARVSMRLHVEAARASLAGAAR